MTYREKAHLLRVFEINVQTAELLEKLVRRADFNDWREIVTQLLDRSATLNKFTRDRLDAAKSDTRSFGRDMRDLDDIRWLEDLYKRSGEEKG